MKLLSKLDVTRNKTIARKAEVEDGAKLARKVDILRELSAKEEADITKFREESVKVLHSTILSKQKEVDDLDKDIKIKKAVLDKLSEPLTEQFKRLDGYKAGLDDRAKDLDKEATKLNQFKIQFDTDKFILEKERSMFEVDKLKLQQEHDFVDSMKGETESLLKIQSEATVNIQRHETKVVSSLQKREVDVAEREVAVKLGLENNKRVGIQHDKERVQLADMRATLERAINRTKK